MKIKYDKKQNKFYIRRWFKRKEIDKIKINIDGKWKDVTSIQINDGNSWRTTLY